LQRLTAMRKFPSQISRILHRGPWRSPIFDPQNRLELAAYVIGDTSWYTRSRWVHCLKTIFSGDVQTRKTSCLPSHSVEISS
jgi:hypothetical protein